MRRKNINLSIQDTSEQLSLDIEIAEEAKIESEQKPKRGRKPKKITEEKIEAKQETVTRSVGPASGTIHKYLDEDTKAFYWIWEDGKAYPIGKEYIEDKHNEVIEVDEL